MSSTRAGLALAGALALTCTGAACSSTATGDAQPAAAPSSTPADSTDSLAGTDPCALLTDPEAARLGFREPPEPFGDLGCDWNTGEWGFVVTVDLGYGLAELDRADFTVEPAPVRIGSHRAERGVPGDGSSCTVWIPVSDSSLVSVDASNGAGVRDPGLACERATDVAELVEPKLP